MNKKLHILFWTLLLSAPLICMQANAFPYFNNNNNRSWQSLSSIPCHSPVLKDSIEPVKDLNINFLSAIAYNTLEAKLLHLLKSSKPVALIIGHSKSGAPIEAWYFPGTGKKNALVIGGVHGSELSSIEVANTLISQLQEQPASGYNLLVIPCLFPDNAKLAMLLPASIGSKENIGRYSYKDAVDPNRQMPSLGMPFSPDLEEDHFNRKMEPENVLLLNLVQLFAPTRIASIHAIRDKSKAGIFADPRTDSKGMALGFTKDSLLAVNMAIYIEANGGATPANQLNGIATARYSLDPEIVPAGNFQPRASCGSVRPLNKGCGISLGSWASTAVEDRVASLYSRPAISIITIEFPGLHRPGDMKDQTEKAFCARQIGLYAASIKDIFLSSEKTATP